MDATVGLPTSDPDLKPNGFRHEALFYRGAEDFVRQTVPFVREGLARQEPVLVVARVERVEALRSALGRDADHVFFGDMATVGRNPACIIPAWADFLSEHAGEGRPVRGIGEPVWAGRSLPELEECHLHEALLNRAFEEARAFWLLCPYDAAELDSGVVSAAVRNHTHVASEEIHHENPSFDPLTALFCLLPEAPEDTTRLEFGRRDLATLRGLVAEQARTFGLLRRHEADVVSAVHELATNSIRHAEGRGTLRIWVKRKALVFEVRDRGVIRDPLVGRRRPAADAESGRGLWLVHHLSELAQIRSAECGTVARIYASRPGGGR